MGQYEPLSTILEQQHDSQWIDSNGARWTTPEVICHLTDSQARTLLEWQVLEMPNCGLFPVLRDRDGKPWLVRDDRSQDEDQCVKLMGQRLNWEQQGGTRQAPATGPGATGHSSPRRICATPRLPLSDLT